MSKKDRLSRDQKRKAKLSKENKSHQSWNSLAYQGNKYKNNELAPFFFATESAIYEAWSRSDFLMTDQAVIAGLETLIQQLRQGPLPPYDSSATPVVDPADHKGLVVGEILK